MTNKNKVSTQRESVDRNGWTTRTCDGCNEPKKCARRVDGKWFCWICATESPNG